MDRGSVRYIVHDVNVAVEFRSEKLDFDVQMHPAPGLAALTRGTSRLLLNAPGAGGAGAAIPNGRLPEPGGWNGIQLEVEDLAAVRERPRKEGVSFRNEIISGKAGKQVLLEVPAVNPVELLEPPER